jgi:hypothetical protein
MSTTAALEMYAQGRTYVFDFWESERLEVEGASGRSMIGKDGCTVLYRILDGNLRERRRE